LASGKRVLYWDIETHSSEFLWDLTPDDFFRLGGYAWGREGEVHITTSRQEMIDLIESADLIIGHNIHAFDLTALYGKDSSRPLELAREGRVWDTWTHASHVHPAPVSYVNRFGQRASGKKPEAAKKWFSLDEQAYQLGVEGKTDNLSRLAKEFGGYGNIPLDNEEYRSYLIGDVLATRHVALALQKIRRPAPYDWREQQKAAIAAQITRNGWRIDREKNLEVQRRNAEIREKNLKILEERYGMPTDGKAPLRTNEGKAAITQALADVGISLDDLPRTIDGATRKPTNRPSFGGQGIIDAAQGKGQEAEELAAAIAALGGIRPLSESAWKHMKNDGKVHPQIFYLQRSGRWSTQDPGLSTWTKKSPEKEDFIASPDDEVNREFDYSPADARMVAAYSGDVEFAKRFDPGKDAHMETAWDVWGKDFVGTDKHDPHTAYYRQVAKIATHGWGYKGSAKTLAEMAGADLDNMTQFVIGMNRKYKDVVRWQTEVINFAKKHGYVVNGWGRHMMVERNREFTQAPALFGQSGTLELVSDALLALPIDILRMCVMQQHDALMFSIPRLRIDEVTATIVEAMQQTWQPPSGGQPMFFPVEVGPIGQSWLGAEH